MQIVRINSSNLFLLEDFIKNLGHATHSFRYFNKRPIEITLTHLYNCLLIVDDVAAGYGHLEKENDIIWLGIAILPKFQGKGLGKKIMTDLIDNAKILNVQSIKLSVDVNNKSAINLYTKYNFQKIKETSDYYIFSKSIV